MTPQRAREGDRRRQLVEIAFQEIAAKGFEGLRFQEVAKQAGINNATLYYYFPSKQALIQGVVDSLTERMKGAPEPPSDNALDELRQMFEGVRRRVTQEPAFFIVITELALRAQRDPAIAKTGQTRDDFWARRLHRMIGRGIAEGVFRADLDRNATVAALMAQIKGIAHHGTMARRKRGEVDAIVKVVAEQVEQYLTGGLTRGRKR